MILRSIAPLGDFPDVALDGAVLFVAYHEITSERNAVVVVHTPRDRWVPQEIFSDRLIDGSGFAKLALHNSAMWLAYTDGGGLSVEHPHNLHLRQLGTGRAWTFVGIGNDPCCFGAGLFAFQTGGVAEGYPVALFDLTSEQLISVRVRNGAPTGLSRIVDPGGPPVGPVDIITVDEDRLRVPGVTHPRTAAEVTVAEGAQGGAVVIFPDLRDVLWKGRLCFTPKIADGGFVDAIAIATHGSDVRLFCGTRAELRAEMVKPIEPPIDPPIDPEVPVRLTPEQFASLQAARDAIDKMVLSKEEGGALLNAWAWKHRNDPNRVGLQRDDSDPRAFMPDGTPIWAGARIIVNGVHYGGDVIVGASVGRFLPNDAEFHPADATGPNGRVEAIDPGGVIDPPASDVDAKLAALESRVMAVVADDRAIVAKFFARLSGTDGQGEGELSRAVREEITRVITTLPTSGLTVAEIADVRQLLALLTRAEGWDTSRAGFIGQHTHRLKLPPRPTFASIRDAAIAEANAEDHAQTPEEIRDAAADPANVDALVASFEGHRASIRHHEESRRPTPAKE